MATGVFDKGGSEMSINLKSNASSVIPQLIAEEEIDAETKLILGKLDNTDMSLIVNNETGFLYIKSPLICTMTGQAEDAWLCLETGEAMSSSDVAGLSELSFMNIGDASSFRDYVILVLKQDLIYDDGSYTVDTLNELNSRFSDQAMVKDGDNYVLTYSNQDSGYDTDFQSKESSKLIFQFNGNTFTGISYSLSSSTCYTVYSDSNILTDELDTSSTEISYSLTALGKGSMSIKSVSNGVTELAVSIDYAFSDTTKTPAREPSKGSNIISVYSVGELGESVKAGLADVGLTA